MILDLVDFGGDGWILKQQQAILVGAVSRKPTPRGQRALDARKVEVIRRFEQLPTGRSCTLAVMPWATTEDAKSYFDEMDQNLLMGVGRDRAKLDTGRTIENIHFDECDRFKARELDLTSSSANKSKSLSYEFAGTIGSTLFWSWFKPVGLWNLHDVKHVVDTQIKRLRGQFRNLVSRTVTFTRAVPCPMGRVSSRRTLTSALRREHSPHSNIRWIH